MLVGNSMKQLFNSSSVCGSPQGIAPKIGSHYVVLFVSRSIIFVMKLLPSYSISLHSFRQTRYLCTVSRGVPVPVFNLRPGDRLGFLYPSVAHFQIHAYRLFEIRQTDLAVAVTIHSRPPGARFFPFFCCFPCTYYTTYGPLCLELYAFFYCSVGII